MEGKAVDEEAGTIRQPLARGRGGAEFDDVPGGLVCVELARAALVLHRVVYVEQHFDMSKQLEEQHIGPDVWVALHEWISAKIPARRAVCQDLGKAYIISTSYPHRPRLAVDTKVDFSSTTSTFHNHELSLWISLIVGVYSEYDTGS